MTDLSRLLAAMIALQESRPGQPSIVAKYAAREELAKFGVAELSPAAAEALRAVDHELDAFRFHRPDLEWAPLWRAYQELAYAVSGS